MSKGENLPHAGRFLTATFFIHAGLPADSIGVMFRGAPDYDTPKSPSLHTHERP